MNEFNTLRVLPAGVLPRPPPRWLPEVGELLWCHLTKEEALDIHAMFGKTTHRIPAIVTESFGGVVCECLWDRRLKYTRNHMWIDQLSPLEALADSSE